MQIVRLLKQALLEWYRSRAFEIGAALAFYAIFSIAPVIVLGLHCRQPGSRQRDGTGPVVPADRKYRRPHRGHCHSGHRATYVPEQLEQLTATVLSIIFFGFGATGLFSQLQIALNAIWEVEPKSGRGCGNLYDRFGSFLAVLGIECACWPTCWSRRSSPRSDRSCHPRPRPKAFRSGGPSCSPSPGHSSHWPSRTRLPHFARRQDRLAQHLGRSGFQRPFVLARQPLDRLVSGSGWYQIGLWCSRFDRDRPAVGLLFFAGLAVRRSITHGIRQTPRCASGTERKRGASQPSEWRWMVGETKVNQRNALPPPPNGVAKDVGELTHDIVSLADRIRAVQKRLPSRTKRTADPRRAAVAGGDCRRRSVRVALIFIAEILAQAAGLSRAAAFQITALARLHRGGHPRCGVVPHPRSRAHVERSCEELTRNLTWIKQVVKRPKPTEEQSPKIADTCR